MLGVTAVEMVEERARLLVALVRGDVGWYLTFKARSAEGYASHERVDL